MILLLFFLLIVPAGCTGKEESRPVSPAPTQRTGEAVPAKVPWRKILEETIHQPLEIDETPKGSPSGKAAPPLVLVKNAIPIRRDAFEFLLTDLSKKICRSDLPYPELAFKMAGEKETILSAVVSLSDACDFAEGEISGPELLRRFGLEEVETLASVRSRAVLARKEGRNLEAREALEKWISFDPKATLAHALLGNIHRDEKRYFDAIRTYLRLQELEPQNFFAAHNLGYCYERVGAYDDSIAAYGRALSLKSNDAVLTKQLALVHQKNGQRRLALDLIATARARTADNELWLIEGNILRDDKQFAKAGEAYQKGLESSPNDSRFLFNLILTDLDQKKYADAKKKFEELSMKDPTLAEELKDVPVF